MGWQMILIKVELAAGYCPIVLTGIVGHQHPVSFNAATSGFVTIMNPSSRVSRFPINFFVSLERSNK
jgi:hypothetical protein